MENTRSLCPVRSVVTVMYISSHTPKISRKSSYCVGVKPVKPSKQTTQCFIISSEETTRVSCGTSSSAIIYVSPIRSVNAWYTRRISCSFKPSSESSPTFSISSSKASSDTSYCANSHKRDLHSSKNPAAFNPRLKYSISFFFLENTWYKIMIFPISSKTVRRSAGTSSKARYAKRWKLSTSIFKIPLFPLRETNVFWVSNVNWSGTKTR